MAERDLVETIRPEPHLRRPDRVDQPRGIDRIVLGVSQLPHRIVGKVGAAEHTRPQAARRRRERRAVRGDFDPHQRHREIVGGPAERQRAQLRLAEHADTGGQRLETLRARRGVGHPEAQRKRAARRIELADDVVQVEEPSFVQLQQLEHEAIRPRHFFGDDRLPQRRHQRIPRRHR